MFTAADARALQECYHKVKENVVNIGEQIKLAIQKNTNLTEYYYGLGSEEVSQGLPVLGPIEQTLKSALEEQGYKVEYTWCGDPYVPRALQDDYDFSGPKYDHYGFLITWRK